jgi:hypothetical protein
MSASLELRSSRESGRGMQGGMSVRDVLAESLKLVHDGGIDGMQLRWGCGWFASLRSWMEVSSLHVVVPFR